MTIYDGWDELEIVKSTGTNPDSENSIVIYAKTAREKKYGYQPYVLISQVITKESLEDFTDDEIFPIEKVHYTDTKKCGGYGPVTITLKDGTTRTIDFEGIEGQLISNECNPEVYEGVSAKNIRRDRFPWKMCNRKKA